MTNKEAIVDLEILLKNIPKYLRSYQSISMGIKALKQEPKTDTLDKIRDKIERKAHSGQWSDATMYGMLKAVAIIDKYKAESEDKE